MPHLPAPFVRALILSLLLALGAQAAQASVTGKSPLPGQIVIDPENPRWLKRHGGAHVFICGPGDPEDFLYRGTRNADGTRAGDQVTLIRKLIEHGGNSIYMQSVRTHGGDAKTDTTQNPFIDSDPAKGLDERILKQWEEWFTLMDANGILIYFFFYDDSARIWNTGDAVGPAERAFFEGTVARFKHHKNLIWVIGEESEERYTTARVQALAEIIRRADSHGHIIGNHHHSGTTFKTWQPGGALEHYSMQLNTTGDDAHAGAIEALKKAGGRYQIIYSESTATPTDPASMRRHAWAVAMGGLMPMMLQADIAGTPVELLAQFRHLQRFFESTDFHTLTPHDEGRHAGTRYLLAAPRASYIAYADEPATPLGIKDLSAGRCEITWLDCQTGRMVRETHAPAGAGDRVFARPGGIGTECAAWIRFPDAVRAPARASVATAPATSAPQPNRAPIVVDRHVSVQPGIGTYVQLRFTDEDGPGPYTYTLVEKPRHGNLTGDDNDRTYRPVAGFTGRDRFTWKVNDGAAESALATVTIDVGPR